MAIASLMLAKAGAGAGALTGVTSGAGAGGTGPRLKRPGRQLCWGRGERAWTRVRRARSEELDLMISCSSLTQPADIFRERHARGVQANFVGEQDRLAGLAGQAAGVWLRAGFQIWSSGLLACWQRSVVMAVAPATVQCMPDSLRRWPMTALQPDSTAPEPTNRPRERNHLWRIRGA